MATYGLKYQTQFTSQSDANIAEKDYRLQFLFKNYVGGVVSVTGGDISVVQRCTIDDPFAPVKGQSLDISLINKGGSLPISAFQSEEDDDILVKLLDANDNVLFTGYTVQDDFYEIMVDYEHPITLSANDGLGLLKGVILSDAILRRSFYVSYRTNGVDTVVYMFSNDAGFYPAAGNTVELGGISYIISTVVQEDTLIGLATYNWTVTLTTSTGGLAQTVETIYLTGTVDLLQRNSLLTMIMLCLAQTNLGLQLNIYHNLYAYQQDNTRAAFAQTLIDSQVFISGETYKDCYEVLQIIMETFNCQVFQANGQWNIIDWHELRYYNNVLPGFIYDETMTFLGTTVLNNTFQIGPDPQITRPLYSLSGGFVRGYKFTKRQFDYNQPKYLLRNYDLQTLGALITQYVNGANTIYEYVATDWENDLYTPVTGRFIRVVRDTASGAEVSRALVVRGDTFNAPTAVQAIPFDITEGDKIVFSFTIQTNFNAPGPGNIVFALALTDGITTVYMDDSLGTGLWDGTSPTYNYHILTGDNFNTVHRVEIETPQAPFSGQVYCYLAQPAPTPSNLAQETYYTDIRLEYQPFISDSTKITGQIHTQTQPPVIKNNSERTLLADDSPRNSIAGTLFLNTKTGLLQDRTTFWRYPPDANGWRLGERTTLEELLWKQRTRSKLEGGFVGNYQQNVISLLTLGITDFNPTKNYTFGLLTIDYKRNQFSGTLWEVYDSEDPELDNTYTFDYIYSTT